MSEITVSEPQSATQAQAAMVSAAENAPCDECVGSGGWYRYEPAMEDSPGMLYLSCVGCRGSGRMALAGA